MREADNRCYTTGMWNHLPDDQKDNYRCLILALAALTPLFSQKSEEHDSPAPYINSKYQETAFELCFNAQEEDIGNTSFDESVVIHYSDGTVRKCIVGIKTFGFASGDQKIAQFKGMRNELSSRINELSQNTDNLTKAEINQRNADKFAELAKEIATERNKRIESSKAQLRGFTITDEDDIESVYHVLMPSPKNSAEPEIYVGETSYLPIDINHLTIIGCSDADHPANFTFTDGRHTYRFTPADMQLYMSFDNADIVKDTWHVKYVAKDEAVAHMKMLYESVYGGKASDAERMSVSVPAVVNRIVSPVIAESYCWMIANSQGEVERYSGFNSFYGIGSKMPKALRRQRLNALKQTYQRISAEVWHLMEKFLFDSSTTAKEKFQKEVDRKQIMDIVRSQFPRAEDDFAKLLFRPMNEMYIPLPNSKKFHAEHPNFFSRNLRFTDSTFTQIATDKDARRFNLVFEPSGDAVPAYITQDAGKAIESAEKQTILGQWILRDVFQLPPYEPLTADTLDRIGINAIRLFKVKGGDDVHLQFIYIDGNRMPDDYWE